MAAAQALGGVDDRGAVPALLQALSDPDSWVRFFAARAVGRHRAPATVSALARLAHHDPATHVRLSAIEALGAVGGSEASAVLASLSGEADELGAAAIGALGQVDEPTAWTPLRDALWSRDPRRRVEAVRALGSRAVGEAVSLLEWAAASSPDQVVLREATEALGRVASTPSPANAGPAAVTALLRLTSDPARREAAIAALGALPASKSDAIASGLADPRVDVRTAAIEALARMRDERATGFLRKGLDDPAAAVRRITIAVLAHLGSAGTAHRLAAMARNDPDAAVRAAAVAALHVVRPEPSPGSDTGGSGPLPDRGETAGNG